MNENRFQPVPKVRWDQAECAKWSTSIAHRLCAANLWPFSFLALHFFDVERWQKSPEHFCEPPILRNWMLKRNEECKNANNCKQDHRISRNIEPDTCCVYVCLLTQFNGKWFARFTSLPCRADSGNFFLASLNFHCQFCVRRSSENGRQFVRFPWNELTHTVQMETNDDENEIKNERKKNTHTRTHAIKKKQEENRNENEN